MDYTVKVLVAFEDKNWDYEHIFLDDVKNSDENEVCQLAIDQYIEKNEDKDVFYIGVLDIKKQDFMTT